MPLPTITGLCGMALLLAAGGSVLARRWTLPPVVRVAIPILVAVLMLVPLGELSAAGYLRGVIGDLSTTTMLLLAAALASSVAGRPIIVRRETRILIAAMLVAGAILYPLALGASRFDPYALGYGSYGFVSLLLFGALLAWYARLHLLVLCISVAAVGHTAGLLESDNLWDYLIDAPLVAYGVLVVLADAVRLAVRRRVLARQGQSPSTAPPGVKSGRPPSS
jgi:hypothetical protein